MDKGYVLITGGSSEIGKEFAIKYAYLGYNLLLIGRQEQKLQKISA